MSEDSRKPALELFEKDGAENRIPPWDNWGKAPKASHVVSVSPYGAFPRRRYTVSRGKHRRYCRVINKGGKMHAYRRFNDNAKFKDNYRSLDRIHGGILLQTVPGVGQDLYVLTAGHAFPGAFPADRIRFELYDLERDEHPIPKDRTDGNEWWRWGGIYNRRRNGRGREYGLYFNYSKRVGEDYLISFGGATEPDFSILRLQEKSSKYLRGYPLRDSNGKSVDLNPPEVGKSFHSRYYIFPNGLEMIYGEHKDSEIQYPGAMWENSPYLFCPLQVTRGCSGGPVFEIGEDGSERLFGMIVAKGNYFSDFKWKGNKEDWNFKPRIRAGQWANGTKILKLSSIWEQLLAFSDNDKRFIGSEQLLDQLLTIWPREEISNDADADTVLGDGDLTGDGILDRDDDSLQRRGTLSGDNSLFFNDTRLIRGPGNMELADLLAIENKVVTLRIEGVNWTLYVGQTLDSFGEDIPAGFIPRSNTWPRENTVASKNMGFRFVEKLQLKKYSCADLADCPVYPEGIRVSALEGIGTMDWVDELPDNQCQWLQRAWVCDGHYIEISLIDNDSTFQIRTVDGFVDVYSRAYPVPEEKDLEVSSDIESR